MVRKQPTAKVNALADDSISNTGNSSRENLQNSGQAQIRAHTDAVADTTVAFLDTFTPDDEKAIMRKVDWRLLPMIALLFLIKQIDVANAASVKVMQVGGPRNILTELHMTADQYNWVSSIYYIAYIVFELPSNVFLKHMSPRIFQTRIVFSWGAVLACHAAVTNKEGLYVARFFLGMMEAGMFPGVVTHICSWYRSDEMGRPIVAGFIFSQASGIIGSLLCYGISYMNSLGGLSGWQWVYLLEGLTTMVFAGVVWVFMPDYPKSKRTAKWLTPREQDFVELRLSENAPKTDDPAFSKQEAIISLKDIRLWSFMLSQTLVNLGGYGLTWFLPTITTNLGFAKLPRNQLLNIPPAAATILFQLFLHWFMRRAYITRPFLIILIILAQIVCFLLFIVVNKKIGIYVACIVGSAAYSGYFIPFWPWRSSTLKGSTGTAFTLALQTSVAQAGGVIGPQLFQSRWAYNGYKTSFAICLAAIVASLFANLYTWYLTRNVEYDVRRIRRERIKAEKTGRLFVEDDIKVFHEREFFSKTLKKGQVPEILV